jgi:uncharacterized protein (DUF1778 family)
VPYSDDGPSSRINVRLPEALKAQIEEAAAKEGRSVNAWLVRAAATSLNRAERDRRAEPRTPTASRSRQSLTGWVR